MDTDGGRSRRWGCGTTGTAATEIQEYGYSRGRGLVRATEAIRDDGNIDILGMIYHGGRRCITERMAEVYTIPPRASVAACSRKGRAGQSWAAVR